MKHLSGIVAGAMLASICAIAPASAFTVSGVSFNDFRKSEGSCYRCGEGRDSEPAAPDPREVQRRDLITQSNYAWSRDDMETAVQLALQALAIRDDPGLRNWIREAQALILAKRAQALGQAGDHHAALAAFRQALSMKPDVISRSEFDRYEAQIAATDRAEAEQRALAEKQQAMMRAWDEADRQAFGYLRQGRWDDALKAYEKARLDWLETSDSSIGIPSGLSKAIQANRSVAFAGRERSRGKLEESIQALQTALSWDPNNEMANALLKIAYAEREKVRTAMEAELRRAPAVINDGGVYAGGPKPLAELNATIPEIANSPQAERARKGLVAASNHDWKVALAWYQDALNHDPGNKALTRAVDLAQWMVNARPVSQPILERPKTSANADDNVNYDTLITAQIYGLLADKLSQTKFASDQDKAKADYFSLELRKQAVEAVMFAEATKQAQQRQSLPFK